MDNNIKFQHKSVEKFSMFILSVFPLLEYYVFAGQFRYADIAGIFVLVGAIINRAFHGHYIPHSYIVYWVYLALQIYLVAGIGGWSDYIPGGVNFAMFSLIMFGFAATFNLELLHKYMKMVFVFASILLLFQQFVYITTNVKVSVFLPIGHQLTYAGMTYNELVSLQSSMLGGIVERFSSIFTEPSHFAQYGLLLFAIELFVDTNKNKLFTKFSFFVVLILVIIQAGAGFIGLLAVAIIKLVYIVFVTRQKKYYFYLAILIPLIALVVNYYLNTTSGTYISERTSELGNYEDRDQTGSTFVRVYYGWYVWGDMDTYQKLFGTSRSYISSYREGGFFNGVTHVFCSQGLIGFLLLAFFFYKCCKGSPLISTSLVLLFLVISLFGSTYIGGLMTIVTCTVVGTMWRYKSNYIER